ncbi:MAG: glutamine-hydrolyzing carbamoyl-phosphate synthase small subunit [Marinilabiliales bacterium]|nr:glutamine-hydrolyzing carbamoyl-phosphate synthase small subunit [Marinilabiliales bacterium]
MDMRKVKLVLEDGTTFDGKSFGYEKSVAGEVVFYTAMTGYPESLTDPSYTGQILVSTYPMIGNYGVPVETKADGLHRHFESDKIHITALVIDNYSYGYSHWNAGRSLADWMQSQQIPGICGIDTRALTKILREKGSMLGKIAFEGEPIELEDPNLKNLVALTSTDSVTTYGDGEKTVVLVDCGVKNNIIRCLIRRGVKVVRVPWDFDFNTLDYDGLFLTNGPGDPTMCDVTVQHIRQAIQKDKPIMGICLGNQLLGLAAGCNTYKLKYGHRSHNQPVLMKGTNRCFITSQNHGYAIDPETIPSDWDTLFYNVNDMTNEGIRHRTKPFFSTQFHPEASSGPVDTEFLFDDFVNNITHCPKG